MQTLIPFSINYEIITNSGPIESNCEGITFINIGAATATVLGVTLQQNQSLTIPCNIGEKDQTKYNVLFDSNADKRLNVLRKSYNY